MIKFKKVKMRWWGESAACQCLRELLVAGKQYTEQIAKLAFEHSAESFAGFGL